MKHTPGPWAVIVGPTPQDWAVYRKSTGTTIAEVRTHHGALEDTAQANAYLMAGADSMLKALLLAEATIERLNRHNSADGTLDVIRAAIAKATIKVCARCNGTGAVDAPFSGSDPSCSACDGTGHS